MQKNVSFVDPAILSKVEANISRVLLETRCTAILLINRAGVVLAFAGEPPLHPNQIGAVGAGVYSSMSIIIRAARVESFSVRVPDNGSNLTFQTVDSGVFLCAFYSDAADQDKIQKELKQLARDARGALTIEQTADGRMENVSFITKKLNELFKM